jgi:predicted amidohydrolase YtcJ
MQDKIGSIESGKLADLAVLDRDYFTVPDVEIKKIRSVLTIVDGKIVHNAGVL